ncbi:hypothetical protein A200_00060 [Parascardovia denticolens IPLA 20019]|uniref:ParB/RepB/Spo0J family partition protein n=1 Tax=Parascardovia denticolens TaxID=78258 RepID=UPI0002669DD6|nr:ParB/RepB/Spo0J family partition protein [Parascardovia denticolens]EIT89087.1 hypothetical protein A200_00060 [Parascardovia denticolens IPLA 20019]
MPAKMKPAEAKISDLLLWQKNPRVEEAEDQDSMMNNIYNFGGSSETVSRQQLMALAESIAMNGYENDIEPVIVVEENGKYIVQDANRRLAAIRLLSTPEKYRDILEDNDYLRLKSLSEDYKDNIPQSLHVVVFPDKTLEDKAELTRVIARKHDGFVGGAGQVPWGAAAKDRFFNRNHTFTDKLEAPFEQQFGQSLTSYLGGGQAVTSTRRIFNAKVTKNYLKIKDIDDVTPEELDRVKQFADEVKAYSEQHNLQLSRFKTMDLENIADPSKEMKINEASFGNMMEFLYRGRKAFLHRQITKRDHILGYKWLQPAYVDLDNKAFAEANMLILALSEFGQLKGGEDQRLLKAYLLSPALRSFFELTLEAFASEMAADLPYAVASHHKENVDSICKDYLKNKKFYQYLGENDILFSTYTEAKSIIDRTDFAMTADWSNNTAHKSLKNTSINQLSDWFNDAVLFTILCEQYVRFTKNTNTPQP